MMLWPRASMKRISGAHADHAARLGDDDGVHLGADAGERLFHLHFKILIADGLDDIVEGVYRVPLDGELRHVGDEDEQYLFIELAQLFGGGHAVEQRQLDIHEHHVVYRFIAGEKAHGVAVDGAFEGGALFFEKRRHAVAEGLRLGGRIFHDGDLDHKNILLHVPKPPLRNFPYERSLIKSINEKEAQVKGKS